MCALALTPLFDAVFGTRRCRAITLVLLGALVVACSFPVSLAAADCNANGEPDEIDVASSTSADCNANDIPDECEIAGTAIRIRNTGSTEFGSGLALQGLGAKVVDWNADGVSDLAIVEQARSSIELYLGRTNAAIGAATSTFFQGPFGCIPGQVRIGDLNTDGLPEIVLPSPGGLAIVNYTEHGAEVLSSIGLNAPLDGLEIGDTDGDGFDEVLTLSRQVLRRYRYRGEPSSDIVPDEFAATIEPNALLLVDLDGDGKDEILTGSFEPKLSILRDDGDRLSEEIIAIPFGGVSGFASADVTADGRDDLVVVTATGDVVVLPQGTEAGFEAPEIVARVAIDSVFAAEIDGLPGAEIIVGGSGGGGAPGRGGFWVFARAGAGRYVERFHEFSQKHQPPIAAITVGDFDDDGRAEVVALRYNTQRGDLYTYAMGSGAPLSDCDGDAVPDECQLGTGDCDANGVLDRCELESGDATDCDADGRIDACEQDCDENGRPDECEILDGTASDCDGNARPDVCDRDCDKNGRPDDCDLADGAPDENCDGLIDNCGSSFSGLSVRSHRQTGGGRRFAIADVDGDLDDDLWVLGPGGISTLVATGSGDLVERTRAPFSPAANAVDATVTDFDGDGDVDLVRLDDRGDLVLFPNNGFGGISSGRRIESSLKSATRVDAVVLRPGAGEELLLSAPDRSELERVHPRDGTARLVAIDLPPGAPGVIDMLAWNADDDSASETLIRAAPTSAPARVLVLLDWPADGSAPRAQAMDLEADAIEFAAGDVDGDGREDLVVAHAAPIGATLFYSTGALGSYTRVAVPGFERFVARHAQVFLLDAEGDGDLDVFLQRDVGILLDLAQNAGGRSFESRLYSIGVGSGLRPPLLAPFDIDADGDVDFAAIEEYGGITVTATLEGRGPTSVPCRRLFRRGDVNTDGGRDVTDAVALLYALFVSGAELPCLEAADVDNDRRVAINDAISLLGYLFLAGAPPAAPFRECGLDVDPPGDPGNLGCRVYPAHVCR